MGTGLWNCPICLLFSHLTPRLPLQSQEGREPWNCEKGADVRSPKGRASRIKGALCALPQILVL